VLYIFDPRRPIVRLAVLPYSLFVPSSPMSRESNWLRAEEREVRGSMPRPTTGNSQFRGVSAAAASHGRIFVATSAHKELERVSIPRHDPNDRVIDQEAERVRRRRTLQPARKRWPPMLGPTS
jgi:hypothetical protein